MSLFLLANKIKVIPFSMLETSEKKKLVVLDGS